jgi:hypothetical protein
MVDNIPGPKHEELNRCTEIRRRGKKKDDAVTKQKKDTIKKELSEPRFELGTFSV